MIFWLYVMAIPTAIALTGIAMAPLITAPSRTRGSRLPRTKGRHRRGNR